VREILNDVRAAELAFDWIADRPLTLGFLGQLQAVLVEDTDGEQTDAGKIRD
jgi:hypothetical protein